LTHDENLLSAERLATRRLEAALARLETAATRSAARGHAARALEAAAAVALVELDHALADPRG